MTDPSATTRPAAWTGTRMARPARDLARSTAFYRDLLGLPDRGGFRQHDGYDGVFFALPGGGELELTSGPVEPSAGTDEDLLVLYLSTLDEVRDVGAKLLIAGVPQVESANPYWNRWGRTFLDPDGYRVVIAATDPSPAEPVEIDWYDGPRTALRELFEYAEDSAAQLDQYAGLGRVLVARRSHAVLGHLQLVPTERTCEIELKNMAVRPDHRGTGVGRALVAEATTRCAAEGWSRIVVATAAADVGNLRFYQRVGFRLDGVERDAFTPATGYPDPVVIDGIPLLDRVWFARDLSDVGVDDA